MDNKDSSFLFESSGRKNSIEKAFEKIFGRDDEDSLANSPEFATINHDDPKAFDKMLELMQKKAREYVLKQLPREATFYINPERLKDVQKRISLAMALYRYEHVQGGEDEPVFKVEWGDSEFLVDADNLYLKIRHQPPLDEIVGMSSGLFKTFAEQVLDDDSDFLASIKREYDEDGEEVCYIELAFVFHHVRSLIIKKEDEET